MSIAGESPADRFKVGVALDAAPPVGDFSQALKAAQTQDATGTPAPAPEPEPPAAPAPREAAPLPTPKVPGLPQAEEWRPKGEKASQQWDAMKAKHTEEVTQLRAQLDLLNKEVSTARNGGTPEFETLRKERDKYKEILRDVAIERDPEFVQTFSTREKAAVDAATQAAGDKGDKLAKLLSAPNSPWRDEQINKLVEDLPASSQRRINAALSVIEQVDVERTAEVARRRATFNDKQSALMTQQKERDAVRQKEMKTAFDETTKQWRERNPFFQEKKGDDAHNAKVMESIRLAEAIYNGEMTAEETAMASYWAAGGPRFLEGWQEALKRAEKAEAALDKLRGVEPPGGKEGAAESAAANAPSPGDPNYLKYLNQQVREAQGRDQALGRRR
jgi:hypothetical protein